jgi:hypothetical protein
MEAPPGKAIGLCRQPVKIGAILLFEDHPSGDTEPPDWALIIELRQ